MILTLSFKVKINFQAICGHFDTKIDNISAMYAKKSSRFMTKHLLEQLHSLTYCW